MKEKGFTLVELLAVLIILGVVALLITPKVITSLDEAEKNSNMTSIKELVKTAELKHSNNEILGTTENITIDYQKNINTDYLEYKGEKPEIGKINIKKNGDIAISVKIGDNCYTKKYFEEDIEVIEFDENTCGSNSLVFTNYELPEIVLSGDGLYESTIDKDRYIYKGANPNNYIWLDENGDNNKTQTEIYRIISYEEDGAIKVIRNESIGTYPWDEKSTRNEITDTYCKTASQNGCNVWGNQSNIYLNNQTLASLEQNFYYKYYPSKDSLFQNQPNIGIVTKNASLNNYLNNLSDSVNYWNPLDNLDEYILDYDWKIGGIHYLVNYNGGDKGLLKEKEEENIYVWKGKVGLMSITEYVETSLNPECTSVYSNYYYNVKYYKDTNYDSKKEQIIQSYDEWPCSNRNYNWMPKEYNEWTLTAHSSYDRSTWTVDEEGTFFCQNAKNTYDVRPSFYLKSTIKLSGLGTIEEPYYIVES